LEKTWRRLLRLGLVLSLTAWMVVGLFGMTKAMAATPDGPFMYVADFGSNMVSVVDLATKSVVKNIVVGNNPDTVAMSPDGTRAYVTNGGNNTVSVIDTNSADGAKYNTVIKTITVGYYPRGIELSLDGTRAYVANSNDNSLSVIDTNPSDPNYNSVIKVIALGNFTPWYITVSPGGDRAFIGNYGGSSVDVIDINPAHGSLYGTVIKSIQVQYSPLDIAFTPDGTRAYVSNADSDTVSVIDTNVQHGSGYGSVIQTIPVGNGPWKIAMTPDGTRAYVANAFSDSVSVIDTNPQAGSSTYNRVIKTIPLNTTGQNSGQHISIAPNGDTAYVGNNDDIVLIDTNPAHLQYNTIIGKITGLAGPVGTGIVPVAVQGLAHSDVTPTSWTETWDPVNGATSYNVYLNGTKVAQGVTGTTYTFQSEQPNSTYSVVLEAAAGNVVGPKSNPDTVNTPQVTITTALSPVTPTGNNGWYVDPVTLTISSDTAGVQTVYNINGGNWQAYTAEVPFESDGTYNIAYGWKDQSAIVHASGTAEFQIDRTAPETTWSAAGKAGSNGWYTGPVSLSLTASDALSDIAKTEYSLDDGSTWQEYDAVAGIQLSQDGSYNVAFRSEDNAGNVENKQSAVIRLDQTAPVTSDNAPADWVSQDATVSLDANDSGSGAVNTYYTLDGGAQQAGTSVSVNGEGQHKLTYWSVDSAGNSEDQHTVTVKIDKTAPVTASSVTPSAPDGQNGWYVHPVIVSLSPTDNMSDVAKTEYSLDGGSTWQAYTSVSGIVLSDDGEYNVQYRSIDGAGNVEAAKSLAIKLDQTAPTINISGVANQIYLDDQILSVASAVYDNLSGVNQSAATMTLDGQPVAPGTSVNLYTLLIGPHTVSVNAVDNAGNAATQSVTFQTTPNILSLQHLVQMLLASGAIDNQGIANSLMQKLQNDDLQSLIHEVSAQTGKHIQTVAANYLIRDAQWLLNH
jgi:YVTN family beta-propeller protein